MASLELLNAAWDQQIGTTAQVARELGVTVPEAQRQLRAAERAGLVVEGCNESRNVSRDFDRQHWELTRAGLAERSRLEAQAEEL